MTYEEDVAYERGYNQGFDEATRHWLEQLERIQALVEELNKKMTHELYGKMVQIKLSRKEKNGDENLHQ